MDPKVLRMVGVGGAVVLAGAAVLYFRGSSDEEQQVAKSPERAQAVAKRQERREKRQNLEPEVEGVKVPLRPFDREVLTLVAQGISQPIQIGLDVLPKSMANVSLHKPNADASSPISSVRIDLNRDRSIDEVWKIREDGKIEREATVSRSRYKDLYVLDGDHWVLIRGSGATMLLQPHVIPTVAADLRPLDRQILELVGKNMQVFDALPGEPVKVSLVQQGRRKKITRVEVDLDRDNSSDERWTLMGKIRRRVSPDDDGKFSEEWELKDDKWVRRF